MSKKFTNTLLRWYKNNPRELPWKQDKDAYSVWLSEIIMQQTRVEYGSKYYIRLKELFPTVQHLANAELQDVMKAWEGLGYYSRARNLHHTAKVVTTELGGVFPSNIEGLKQLKGVGPYTAAAIASFAFSVPKAAIDGNAFRVLARHFGIHTPIDTGKGKSQFQKLGDDLIDQYQPGKFNQALMNFGALVCTPKQPDCSNCPFQLNCYAYQQNKQDVLPVKSKSIKIKKRYFTYFLLRKENNFLIQERTGKDVWQNLHEFYLIESNKKTNWDAILDQSDLSGLRKKFKVGKVIENETQQLSHQKIIVDLVELNFEQLPRLSGMKKVDRNDLQKLAFPKVLNVILKKVLT